VLPPGIGGADVAAGRGRVYTDCGKANMIRYSNSCNVQFGASIYLKNTSTYVPLRLEGEIVALDEPPWPNMTWDESAFQYDVADLEY
jgi:hypothetical protein